MATNNVINRPNISFSGYLNAADIGITGDNVPFTLGTATPFTIDYNNGGGFNSNGTFTAPNAGVYYFQLSCGITNFTPAMEIAYIRISTAFSNFCNPYLMQSSGGFVILQSSFSVLLGAGATVIARLYVGNSTKTCDTFVTNKACCFSGFLAY